MKFIILALISLAVIVTTVRTNPIPKTIQESLKNCSYDRDILKKFDNCNVSDNDSAEYVKDYVCLLSVNILKEACKFPKLVAEINHSNKTSLSKTICPFNYSLKNNLGTNINEFIEFLKYEKNCSFVFKHFSAEISEDCHFMVYLNGIINGSIAHNSGVVKEERKQSKELSISGNKSEVINTEKIVNEDLTVAETGKLKLDESQGLVLNGGNPGNTISAVPEKTKTTECQSKVEDKNINGLHSNNNNGAVKTTKKPIVKDVSNFNKDVEIKKSQIIDNNENTNSPETDPLITSNGPDIISVNVNKNSPEHANIKTAGDEGEDDDDNDEDFEKSSLQGALPDREPEYVKSSNTKEIYSSDNFFQAEDSHFSAYFLVTVSIIIIGYIIYHNKNKIVAYALEGRRNRNGRRRPTSASYRKLDCNLEEAIASNPSNASVTNVVY